MDVFPGGGQKMAGYPLPLLSLAERWQNSGRRMPLARGDTSFPP
jgi:hypothetical protein